MMGGLRVAQVLYNFLAKEISNSDPNLTAIQNILLIGLGGIGDIIMKTPAIVNLRKSLPEADLTVLSNQGPGSEVLINCPYIDQVRFIGREKPSHKRNKLKMLKLIFSLRKKGFDMVITSWCGLSIQATLFAYLTGAPIRVGYNKDGQGFLHNVQVPVEHKKHTIEHNLDLIRALGISIEDKMPQMWPTEEDYHKANKFLKHNHIEDTDLVIGIYPGSNILGQGKRWFPTRYAQVANRLVNHQGAKVMIFGGPQEREAANSIENHSKHALINAVGRFSVNEAAALIKRCDLFICNDGGVMHIAEAMKVPIISIWGPTDPSKCRPYGTNNMVITPDIDCAPCYTSPLIKCKHRECLRLISVDKVMEVAATFLEKRGL